MMCCLIIRDKVWWGSSGEMYGEPLGHSARQKFLPAPTRVHCVVFNDSLSLALIGLPKASQSSPHEKHKLPWKFVVVAAV